MYSGFVSHATQCMRCGETYQVNFSGWGKHTCKNKSDPLSMHLQTIERERKVREETELKAKEEAERKAKDEAEQQRQLYIQREREHKLREEKERLEREKLAYEQAERQRYYEAEQRKKLEEALRLQKEEQQRREAAEFKARTLERENKIIQEKIVIEKNLQNELSNGQFGILQTDNNDIVITYESSSPNVDPRKAYRALTNQLRKTVIADLIDDIKIEAGCFVAELKTQEDKAQLEAFLINIAPPKNMNEVPALKLNS